MASFCSRYSRVSAGRLLVAERSYEGLITYMACCGVVSSVGLWTEWRGPLPAPWASSQHGSLRTLEIVLRPHRALGGRTDAALLATTRPGQSQGHQPAQVQREGD